MEFTEAEKRRQALEQDLKQAMLEFEQRKRHYSVAKSSGAVGEEQLQELAFRVDVAVNAAWDLTQLLGRPAH